MAKHSLAEIAASQRCQKLIDTGMVAPAVITAITIFNGKLIACAPLGPVSFGLGSKTSSSNPPEPIKPLKLYGLTPRQVNSS